MVIELTLKNSWGIVRKNRNSCKTIHFNRINREQ